MMEDENLIKERKFDDEEVKKVKEDLKRIESSLQDEKEKLEKNPEEYFREYRKKLEETIPKLPDREPIHKGNITMKTHLQNIVKRLDDDIEDTIAEELESVNKRLDSIKKQLDNIGEINEKDNSRE